MSTAPGRMRLLQAAALSTIAFAGFAGAARRAADSFNSLRSAMLSGPDLTSPDGPRYRRRGRRTGAQAKRAAKKQRNRLRAKGHFKAAVR